MQLTLAEIMNGNKQIILYCQDGVLITWNLSKTLNCYAHGIQPHLYKAMSCKTMENIPKNIDEAIERAKEYYCQ